MDSIKEIVSICVSIYELVEKVKANKERCRRIAKRAKGLEVLVEDVKTRKTVLKSESVGKTLLELKDTLTSARDQINRYTKANWLQRVVMSGRYTDGFDTVNERLTDAYQVLSGCLQVEQSNALHLMFDPSHRQQQDEKDRQEYKKELKSNLDEFTNVMTKMMEQLNKPSASDVMTRMIKPEELTYDLSKEPTVTSSSEVYKGEYHGFTVAIKRFFDQADTSLSEICSFFDKEVDTMKRFDSPNILRMFGVCIKNEGPKPEYLIIMEYCEKGSLREVLDSDCELPWIMKARMCLDAAQALYRLHQTEEKFKVHGCITSSKFLVAESYRVKLGSFELAQTESSLRRGRNAKGISSLCYSSPQLLLGEDYSKECEIYSLGIVMWEIATRRYPFEDPNSKAKWNNKEILQRVGNEKYMEPLPEDCPEALGDLINDCRAFEICQRPSAGVLVDKLRILVTQMEE